MIHDATLLRPNLRDFDQVPGLKVQDGLSYSFALPGMEVCKTAFPSRLSEHWEVHTLELPKFHQTAEERAGDLDRWAWFLSHVAGLDGAALPAALQQPAIQQATEVLEFMSMDVQERLRAEARRKALLDYNQLMLEARELGEQVGFAKGEQAGFAKGEQAGFAKGEQAGFAKGEQLGADKGFFLGRIDLLCRLNKEPAPDRTALETMSLAELAALTKRLEQEALGP